MIKGELEDISFLFLSLGESWLVERRYNKYEAGAVFSPASLVHCGPFLHLVYYSATWEFI